MDQKENLQRVIRSLQWCGRSGAREIAYRTGMTNEKVIALLLELERLNRVEQANGYWWLAMEPVELVKKVARRKACTK
ncbi:hypothetical protein MXF13_02165 [Leclercia adecarboxylata]|uniref:hypothetical protein n=1 Tax=Leclercia adecarboxylata TaxID=83655 RepID=UPI002DBAD634|nr:hypothetical protein [Leclercia adecarboxylata]MEB5748694.1 hypothetical protein [Leclercia adecarboxylata]